jgi:hypothetical protein
LTIDVFRHGEADPPWKKAPELAASTMKPDSDDRDLGEVITLA